MDPKLAKIMENNVPALNRDLADGLVVKHLKNAESYIDAQIRSVAKYFPDDLKYTGFRRCTPMEEYRETTRKKTYQNKNNRSSFNLARSDTYLVALHFSFKGEEIIRYISLPFINQAGNIHISGVRFIISPVMCDKIISIGVKDIFVKLNLAKLIFQCEPQYYIANEQREMIQVIHAEIYNRTKKNKSLPKTVKAKTTMTHYLFCRHGFYQTMREFAGCNPIVGYEDTINERNYPADKYVICKSVGLKPRTLQMSREEVYHASKIRIAVPIEEYTPKAKNHIVSFFYLVDHWPKRITPEDIDKVRLWKQLLGELIWGSGAPLGRLEADAEKHLVSLDNYIDTVMEYKFEQIGIPIKNFYQLLGVIVDNFSDWVLKGNQNISSMYNKELDILYYVLNDIIAGINNFYFKLTNLYSKKGDNVTIKEIIPIFNSTIKPGLVFKLSSTGKHIEVSTINSSCDNKAFKTTAILVPQETTGSNSDNKSSNDPSRHLHASVAEVNVYSAINKRDPSGHNRINLCVNIGDKGEIVRNPKFVELLDNIQTFLSRKL